MSVYKIIIIVGLIPLIVNIILYVIPLKEKGNYGKVTVSKSTYLVTPIVADIVFGFGLIANTISYINGDYSDREELKTIVLFSCIIPLTFIPLIYYKKSIVKYDSEKIYYHKKWYSFSEIETFGYNEKHYSFVTKSGEKIKIDGLAVGFDSLYKTYQQYLKRTKPNKRNRKHKR